ncbi:hypothetical protein AGMMS49579_25290 [Spirochaetia bacterium]|nr:hypothetical protein AGMMS49579_25290 [Spirochaetia bacterium]
MKIATEINLIQNENNIESPIKPKLAAILYFVYFSGIIYIQKNINKTVDVIGVDNEKYKKSLIITIIYGLLLLILVLSVFLGVFKGAGLIGEKREPLIVLGITSAGNQDASFSIEKAGTYALWVNCNFEYSNGFSPLLNITITKNDDIIVKKQYTPLKTSLTINSVETTVNGKTKKRFRGRFEKIDFETGDYEIMVESIIGEHLLQLNEYQFYIQ